MLGWEDNAWGLAPRMGYEVHAGRKFEARGRSRGDYARELRPWMVASVLPMGVFPLQSSCRRVQQTMVELL